MTLLDPAVEQRVNRLSTAAAKRVVEPDDDVPGGVGDGQLLPDRLLSIAGLDLDLTPEQKRILSREEIASIAEAGIRFEAVLTAGFGAQIATSRDITDPRLTFILHEIGEESRHQRLFQRLIASIGPTAKDPLPYRVARAGMTAVVHAVAELRALFYVLVLGGEEIPDLFQKLASEDPDTDDFVRAVNKYHRMEEARHLSFARAVYPEVWAEASLADRIAVRRVAPFLIGGMFETIVHPGVYATIGLPRMKTWRAANRTPQRVQLRWMATRPVLQVLLDSGAIKPGRVPKGWRALCGVDRHGNPLPNRYDGWE